MSSEIIVVLVLIVLAIAFVIWIRMNSHERGSAVQEEDQGASTLTMPAWLRPKPNENEPVHA